MISTKKFVSRFLCLTCLPILLIAGYNVWNDTSGLYNTDFSQPRPEPNQHFVKMRYLLANPTKYDAFCFGSSRVGNIDLQKIPSSCRYYNMTYSEGLPQECLNDLTILLHHHVTVKQVMLGLDDFSFRVNPQSHETQYLRIPYKENNLPTYFAYLMKKPEKPYQKLNIDKRSIFDIYDSGRPLHPAPDEDIEAHPEKHQQEMNKKKPTLYTGNRIAQTIQNIHDIKQICTENNIELIVFINPIHHKTYEANNLDEFDTFKRELAKITPYYDFSGLNRITTNDYYYYETSHYRPIVGDMIIHRIFDMPKDAETDFGKYVEQAN